MDKNLNQLHLLSIAHYAVAVLAAFVASTPVIHLVMGLIMLVLGITSREDTTFRVVFVLEGLIFMLMAVVMIAIGWTFAVCMAAAGRFLSQKRRYLFCQVMGGLVCTFIPFGTVLGVLTNIVLARPAVRGLFRVDDPLNPASAVTQAAPAG